ncbi:ABC transporter substrate-binding protein [Roseovarius dicentrarchi]|uniref:ABC transporter substrate-binding protein n=1 Tax=Roseovarius dicentrarchi TaxID=2250573 RepID=UPI000DEA0D2D|nr:ABC transporter substrate-binding protein [Roseovarius dicentrarchi]
MSLLTASRLNRRGFLKATAATAIATSFAAGGAIAAPKRGGHLRIGFGHGQTTDTLDPATLDNDFIVGLSFAVHGRLVEVAPDGDFVPELAESWEASADAATWRFKLRKGVTFHSGKPVTAGDVVASIRYHRDENSTSAAAPLVSEIETITIEGDDTIIFELAGGNADFPFTLTDYHLVILPLRDGALDWQSGDGCGSYILKDIEFGVSALLERNPDHWRDDVAWFDSIEMLALVDQNARTSALVSGDIDAADRLDRKTLNLLARSPAIDISEVAGTQHYTFAMSTNQTPFDDNNVRLALKHAVDRQELVDKILFGYGSVGNDIPVGPNQKYYNTELEQRVYDPDKARWHLRQAGLDSLTVSLHAADAAFTGAVDAAQLFQNTASKAGITIKPVREPNDGYWSSVWMKKPFSAVYWDGRPVMDKMFASAYTCGASWNDTFWCHERFEKLLVEARGELDEAKRREMYFELQEIVHDQGGAIIPMFASYVFGTSKKVGKPDVMGSNLGLDGSRWAERWWFV